MSNTTRNLAALRRPAFVITAAAVVVVVLVWLFVFFIPQSHKLTSLGAERVSLNALITKDNAKLQTLREETHHVGQIQAMDNTLTGYVPRTEEVYTYVHTLSAAAKSSGVSITSLGPGALAAVPGTLYMAVPITVSVKGTFGEIRAFLQAVYNLPRLTDVNALTITTGGGTVGGRVATIQLAIFTSQKSNSSGG